MSFDLHTVRLRLFLRAVAFLRKEDLEVLDVQLVLRRPADGELVVVKGESTRGADVLARERLVLDGATAQRNAIAAATSRVSAVAEETRIAEAETLVAPLTPSQRALVEGAALHVVRSVPVLDESGGLAEHLAGIAETPPRGGPR